MLCLIASGNKGKQDVIANVMRSSFTERSLTFLSEPVQIEGHAQPWGKDETEATAKQRVQQLIKTKSPDHQTLLIAQESGLNPLGNEQVEIINTTVIYWNGHWATGWAQTIPLTEEIRKLVQEDHLELADAFGKAYKEDTNRQGHGGVYIMTNGRVTRPQLIEESTKDAITELLRITPNLMGL